MKGEKGDGNIFGRNKDLDSPLFLANSFRFAYRTRQNSKDIVIAKIIVSYHFEMQS